MSETITQDPELYAKMAQPYPTKEAAADALAAFFEDVKAARERHRIPEVVLVAAAHVEPHEEDDDHPVKIQAMAKGSHEWAERLAAIGFRVFVGPASDRAGMLQRIATGTEADDHE